ncbi:L,D-transpeptidase family protein [Nitrosomonas sp. Nm33]|uniref:L,D-transpeptidase family protein n=1 Tax=Nitrosomonas sp. Nm33 TaxID=133724 RepID=UPI00089AC808|nr:L,D-transpeptidase family protein [Nitrosomonas sp. Nm33]SDZ06287.1 L,D-transpeptidase ErfK/SrfK [Nitrosomonas sp. Nm33]
MSRILSSMLRSALMGGLLSIFFFLGGCQPFMTRPLESPIPVAKPLPVPVASHEFSFDSAREDVVGMLQVITTNKEDTLSDIARRFNLGYEEIVSANPGVDPWLPGEGTEIVIPTQFVLPDAPRKGIVINLAAMRLFYFPKTKDGEPQKVITHPLGIGRVGWRTPEGVTKISSKVENPAWIPTPSIRKEHAENGDLLPAIVPPGPDNPMGTHVLRLAWPKYAIHGTDKPPSIGLRGSHGCLRMYPEDIVRIYNEVPVGTPVCVVNQPRLLGWRSHELYLQTYPILEDDKRDNNKLFIKKLLNVTRSTPKAKLALRRQTKINPALLKEVIQNPRAIAIPITQPNMTLQTYLDRTGRVQNILPLNATWDGDKSRQLTAAEVLEMADKEP